MTKEIKNKYLILAIVFLLVMNASTIVTLWLKSNDAPIINYTMGQQGDTVNYNNHFFTYYLKLSPTQIAAFREINQKYIVSKNELSKMVGSTNIELSELLQNGGDRDLQQILYDKIISLHRQMKIKNYKYYNDITEICNDEQKKLLLKFFSATLCIDKSLCGEF